MLALGLYELRQAPRRRTARILGRVRGIDACFQDDHPLRALTRWLVEKARPWLPSTRQEELRQQLLWAGQPFGLTADEFLFAKFALAAVAAVLLWLTSLAGSESKAGLLFIGAAVGYILPDRLLKVQVAERTRRLRIDLPHFAQLLAAALDAGLPMIEAVRRVAAEAPGLLSAEMMRTVQEMAAGKPAAVAWEHLASRTDCQELKDLITAIVQSQSYGVGVAEQIRFQMRAMRNRKQQEAREKAAAASVQMKIPTIVFIVMPTMIILMGPVFVTLVSALGGN
jgi:tight adherence protein C